MEISNYISKLRLNYYSILISVIGIGIFSIFFIAPIDEPERLESLFAIFGVFVAIFFTLVFLLYQKQKTQEAQAKKNLTTKLIGFQRDYMVFLLLLSAPAVVNFIFYGTGTFSLNLILGSLFTLFVATRFPNINLLTRSLALKKKDLEKSHS